MGDWHIWLYLLDFIVCFFLFVISIRAKNDMAIYGWASASMLSMQILMEKL